MSTCRGLHLREVPSFKRCLPKKGLSTLGKCPPERGVCLGEVTLDRCLTLRIIYLRKVSTLVREMSVLEKNLRGAHLEKADVLKKCLP